ncbi:MAG TPA: IS3 family transposase, partial [Chryseobacterium sp.]|nr:IS3 family transposase [Chryseobacterium sp.]
MKNREKTVEKRTQQDYTMAFKLGIVSRVEKGEFTYKQAQQHYGIQGRSIVLFWLTKYLSLLTYLPIIHTMLQSKETPAEKINR